MNRHILMKTIKYILSSILLISGIYACNDDWDSHYSQEEQVVNNVNITVVNKSAVDYLQSQPELSSMYQLFSETGVLDEMVEKNLLFTILVTRMHYLVQLLQMIELFWLNHTFRIFLFLRLICRMDNVC